MWVRESSLSLKRTNASPHSGYVMHQPIFGRRTTIYGSTPDYIPS